MWLMANHPLATNVAYRCYLLCKDLNRRMVVPGQLDACVRVLGGGEGGGGTLIYNFAWLDME